MTFTVNLITCVLVSYWHTEGSWVVEFLTLVTLVLIIIMVFNILSDLFNLLNIRGWNNLIIRWLKMAYCSYFAILWFTKCIKILLVLMATIYLTLINFVLEYNLNVIVSSLIRTIQQIRVDLYVHPFLSVFFDFRILLFLFNNTFIILIIYFDFLIFSRSQPLNQVHLFNFIKFRRGRMMRLIRLMLAWWCLFTVVTRLIPLWQRLFTAIGPITCIPLPILDFFLEHEISDLHRTLDKFFPNRFDCTPSTL